MMNREQDQENAELDSFDSSLLQRFQRQTLSQAEKAEANAIWMAMHAELYRETENILQTRTNAEVPSKNFFSYQNMLAFAAASLLVAFCSIFVVAAKQRSDGTVLSSTTRAERLTPGHHRSDDTSHKWLPEEHKIWTQLMSQTASGIDPDSTVVVTLSLHKKY